MAHCRSCRRRPCLAALLGALTGACESERIIRRWRKQPLPALREVRPAFVPLAVTPLYLRAMETRGYDPFESLIEPAQWRRQWAMWRW
jgi:phytoene synthase